MAIRRLTVYSLGFACVAVLGATQSDFFAPAHPELEQDQPKKKSGPARPADFGLFVAPAHLDFGEAFEDRQFAWTVAIENRGPDEIHIKRFDTACSCVEVVPSRLSIPPGENVRIALNLDLSPSLREQPTPAMRSFKTSFQAVVRSPSGEETRLEAWELAGKVRKVLDLSRLVVDFGRHSDRRQPLPAQRIIVKALVPVRSLAARCNAPDFELTVAQDQNDASKHELTLVPKKRLPVSRYQFRIQLEAELPSGQKARSTEIQVQGEVASDVQSSPPTVSLGARPVGTAVDQVVTLYSLTDCPFSVIGYHSKSKGLTIESVSLDSNAAQPRFRLSQRIEELGGQRGSVMFLVVPEDGVTNEIRVEVHYHGVEPVGE